MCYEGHSSIDVQPNYFRHLPEKLFRADLIGLHCQVFGVLHLSDALV